MSADRRPARTYAAVYTGYAAAQPARLRSNVEVIYNEIK